MKRIILAFAVLAGLSGSASAQVQPFWGQVMIFAGNYCPIGWSTMQGQLLSIAQNAGLFAVMGTTYGGDGRTTFALPTALPITTQSGVTLMQCIALVGSFPSRP
jgi:microcystin-dependent protein